MPAAAPHSVTYCAYRTRTRRGAERGGFAKRAQFFLGSSPSPVRFFPRLSIAQAVTTSPCEKLPITRTPSVRIDYAILVSWLWKGARERLAEADTRELLSINPSYLLSIASNNIAVTSLREKRARGRTIRVASFGADCCWRAHDIGKRRSNKRGNVNSSGEITRVISSPDKSSQRLLRG